jgi:hypothetical protein
MSCMSHACHMHVRFGDAESFRPCAAMCQSSPQRSLCCPTAERTRRPRRAGRRDAAVMPTMLSYVMMFQDVSACSAAMCSDWRSWSCSFPFLLLDISPRRETFFHLCDSTEKIDEDRRYDKIDIRHKLSDPMAIGPMQYLYHEFHVMNDFEWFRMILSLRKFWFVEVLGSLEQQLEELRLEFAPCARFGLAQWLPLKKNMPEWWSQQKKS